MTNDKKPLVIFLLVVNVQENLNKSAIIILTEKDQNLSFRV